jgi:hypothetical protein
MYHITMHDSVDSLLWLLPQRSADPAYRYACSAGTPENPFLWGLIFFLAPLDLLKGEKIVFRFLHSPSFSPIVNRLYLLRARDNSKSILY